MKSFDYISTATLDETCDALAEFGSDSCVLAGGTDLLIEFRRSYAKKPKVVVDISRVKELSGIRESGNSITINPLATHKQLMVSELLERHAPLLSAAASTIGSPQIRNRGTIGGNIMNAAACADTVPPLVALGAVVTLRSKSGSRTIDLSDLFAGPYKTHARPDELLTSIDFSKLSHDAGSAFIKLGRRNALSISRLSVAAIVCRGADGRIAHARIVPGAAFPTWTSVAEAEELLTGELPSPMIFAAAGKKVSEVMIAQTGRRWSTEYKEPVIGVLVRRALEQCIQNALLPAGVGG